MNFKIGYRTIKTALGAAIAIMIAQYFDLENYASAGILAILCIQVTRKSSLRASWDRFIACLIAMVFSVGIFELLGYHPVSIGLLLLFFIPTVVMIGARDGIVTSCVIILHIFVAKEVTSQLLLNELGIIAIGIGIALIMNLYMPSVEGKLADYSRKIETNFKKIFLEMAIYLRQKESTWGGQEITETSSLLDEAKTLAFKDVENHLLRHENLFYNYFKMREKQFEILERVLPLVTSISLKIEQGRMVADFIENLGGNVHFGNTAQIYIEQLNGMKSNFETMELPKTREEFEARAALLQLVKELNQYLILKESFNGLKSPAKPNRKLVKEAN